MTALTAPAPRSWPTVDQGTYVGRIDKVDVQDFTVTPDTFGNTGHYTLIFRWVLEGIESDQGEEISIPHYVRFETGTRPYSKGARAGKMPWLTEITRAIGIPDIEPEDSIDPDLWVGRRAKLGILLEARADGSNRNRINSAQPVAGNRKAGTPKPVFVAPAVDEEDEGDVPF